MSHSRSNNTSMASIEYQTNEVKYDEGRLVDAKTKIDEIELPPLYPTRNLSVATDNFEQSQTTIKKQSYGRRIKIGAFLTVMVIVFAIVVAVILTSGIKSTDDKIAEGVTDLKKNNE